MAVDPRLIELFRTQQEPVDQDNPGLMRWLHHNFGALKLLKDDLEAALAEAVDDADIAALQAQINQINITLGDLQTQINNISLTPGPPGAPGVPGLPGPAGPQGPSGVATCAPVLAIPDGWQITDEECGTIFVGM